MQAEEIILVAAGQSPFIKIGRIWGRRERLRIGIWSVDCHGAESGETSRMVYMDTVQRSIECILKRCSGVIGDLNPGFVLGSIVVDIEIRALVESMMDGLGSRL